MERTPQRSDVNTRELLLQARKIADRLIGILEILEQQLGMNEGEHDGGR